MIQQTNYAVRNLRTSDELITDITAMYEQMSSKQRAELISYIEYVCSKKTVHKLCVNQYRTLADLMLSLAHIK